jgi:hypothetical protein
MLINIPFYYSHNINKNVVRYSSAILQRIIFFYYYDQINELTIKGKKVNFLKTEQEEIFKKYIKDILLEATPKPTKDEQIEKLKSELDTKKMDTFHKTINDTKRGIEDVGRDIRQGDVTAQKNITDITNILKNTSRTIKVNQDGNKFSTLGNRQNKEIKESFKETITSDEPTWVQFENGRTNRVKTKTNIIGIKSLNVEFKTNDIIYTLEDDFRKKFFLRIKSKLRQFSTKIHKKFGNGPSISPLSQPVDTTTFLNNKLSAIFYSTIDFQGGNIDVSEMIDNYEILARLRRLGWKIILIDDMLNKTIYFLIPYGKIFYYKESISYNQLASYFKIKNKGAAEEIYNGLQDLKRDLSKLFTSIA